ncbi:MAG: acetyl/propionyl-CoA carboxylase subunit alpha, partial [Actinomycetota bacterium]|nr:acetyl/propionyl-CoA carboxylase subunit alpha [Actinomycetota bacterium]
AVHGLDLVGWQLAIAEGAALPAEPPPARGHAVEVRLYAEDPMHDWRPASGVLHRFHVPGVDAEFAVPAGEHGLRCDSGVRSGDVIGVHYDPMLAKLIAHAPDRASALRRLSAALRGAQLHGLTTNRELLIGLLGNREFVPTGCDTGYLDRNDPAALSAQPSTETVQVSALAAALALAEQHHAASSVNAALPTGWRNLRSQPHVTGFTHRDEPLEIRHSVTRGVLSADLDAELISAAPDRVLMQHGNVTQRFVVHRYGDAIDVDSPLGAVSLTVVPALPEPTEHLAAGAMVAPMPGSVIRVSVQPGEQVEAGAEILVLEAMKMEHRVLAPEAGEVTEIVVTQGQQVEAGAVLAVITGGQS